jgi:Domain of unknown function (DUF4123)
MPPLPARRSSKPESMAASPQYLIDALESVPGTKFAVIDAAHFDDLQSQLKSLALPFTPLFLDERDENALAAGPHLVPLSDRDAAKAIATLCAEKPAVVWWVWPDEGEATQGNLVRHLRGINMAEIPVDRYDSDPALPGDDGGTAAALAAAKAEAAAHSHEHEGHDHGHDHPPFVPPVRYELVLFRHADANVMAMLLPLLDADQVSRLFGKASGLVLDAPDHGGLKAYPRPQNLPDMSNGWLQIRPEQYEGLGGAYQASLLRKLQIEEGGNRDVSSRKQIEAAFQRALGYQVYRYEDLRDFVRADLKYGPGFELQPGREDAKLLLANRMRKATLRVLDAIDLVELED